MSRSRLAPATQSKGDLLLPSGSWGVAVLRQFLPKGLEEELLFDSISSKALKRPFFDSSWWGSSSVCSRPAATTRSGAALCQGMVPSRQGRILSRNHSAGMRWGTQELCSAEDQPPWSHTQHPKHEPPALAAATKSCPHHTQVLVPSRRAGSARSSWTRHPPARLCPSHLCLLIPAQLPTEHTMQGINASITTEPSQHPQCPTGHPPQMEP